MSKTKHHRKIRDRLYAADRHCFWCRRPTRQVKACDGRLPDDAATLDHFRSRLDPLRGKVPGEPRHVLACKTCNENRGYEDAARFSPVLYKPVPVRKLTRVYVHREPFTTPTAEALRREQTTYTQLLEQVTAAVKTDGGGEVFQ